jgi:hypothetical protein
MNIVLRRGRTMTRKQTTRQPGLTESLLINLLDTQVASVQELMQPLQELLGTRQSFGLDLDEVTIGDIVLHDSRYSEVFSIVKCYAKQRIGQVENDAERMATRALYYAAIAAAMSFWGEKITKFSYQELRQRMDIMAARPWMPAEVQSLYAQAGKVCERQQNIRHTAAGRNARAVAGGCLSTAA